MRSFSLPADTAVMCMSQEQTHKMKQRTAEGEKGKEQRQGIGRSRGRRTDSVPKKKRPKGEARLRENTVDWRNAEDAACKGHEAQQEQVPVVG